MEPLFHQELARQRHADLIRNASIRYARQVTFEPTPAAPELRRTRRSTLVSRFRRSAPAGA